ncbi:MAG: hypothetical protein HGA55_06745 [Methanoregulaceae archaeon]|nr:hypothetical protein [Methanoregulaceae archaeon]
MQRKGRFLLAAIALLIGGILLAGCLSVPRLTPHGPVGPGEEQRIGINLLRAEADFSPTRGCIWDVTVQVYNPGNATAGNVQVYLELVDAVSGAVRDTRTVYIGSLPAGESKTVIAELDGDCINEYNLRAVPVFL